MSQLASTNLHKESEYQRFLKNFDLTERVLQTLGIVENDLSRHLVTRLTSGASREFDENSVLNIQKHLPQNGICLAVGDGCSLPLNPPLHGSPWLTTFLTGKFPEARIISSDIENSEARFIFLKRNNELLAYGGIFSDFENAHFYRRHTSQISEQVLADDQKLQTILETISDSESWQSRSISPFCINSSKPYILKQLLSAMNYQASHEGIEIGIIGAKDPAWEKAIFGIDSRPGIDILKLSEVPGISKVNYLLARHLTPEVLENVMEDLSRLTANLSPDCFVDISTIGIRTSLNCGTYRFGIQGRCDSLTTFNEQVA